MNKLYFGASTLVLSLLLQGCGNTAPPKAVYKDERLTQPAATATSEDEALNKVQTDFEKNFSALAQVGGEDVLGAYNAAGILDSLIDGDLLIKNIKEEMGEEKFKKAKVDVKKLSTIRDIPMDLVMQLMLSESEEQLVLEMAKDIDAKATDEAIKATIIERLTTMTGSKDSDAIKDPTFSQVLKDRKLNTETSALLHELVLRLVRGQDFEKESKNRVLVEVLNEDGKKTGTLLTGFLEASDDKKTVDVKVLNYETGAAQETLDLDKDAAKYRIVNSDDALRERVLQMYLKRETDKDGKTTVNADVQKRIAKARGVMKKQKAAKKALQKLDADQAKEKADKEKADEANT
jgi:hypothetical protein